MKKNKTAAKSEIADSGAEPKRRRKNGAGKPTSASAAPEAESKAESSAADFPIFDEEAAAWVYKPSIMGAYAPVLYIGEIIANGISQMLGRSLTLPEAQHLVAPDGDPILCHADQHLPEIKRTLFQPVKYLPFIPKSLAQRLANGERFTDIDLPWGGAYYVTKDNTIIGFSGACCHYDRRRRKYMRHERSPLVMMARVMQEQKGLENLDWGVPFADAERIRNSRIDAAEQRTRLASLADGLLINKLPRRGRRSDRRGEHADREERSEDRGHRRNGHAVETV